jgi:hypothetical protein
VQRRATLVVRHVSAATVKSVTRIHGIAHQKEAPNTTFRGLRQHAFPGTRRRCNKYTDYSKRTAAKIYLDSHYIAGWRLLWDGLVKV